MSNEVIQETTPLVECSAFHRGMSVLEASLRNTEDSEAIISGLLKGAAEFYGASRASVVEADWDLGIGVITYEWCKDGVPAQRDMLQCLPMEKFPRWRKALRANKPVVISDLQRLEKVYPDEAAFFREYGVTTLLAAPFSKRINQGFIAVDDPTRYTDDPVFLFIASYAVVVELNEIKQQQSLLAATKASKYNPEDIHINFFGGMEIISSKGTLTGEDIKADQCYLLLAYLILNHKKNFSVDTLAEIICPYDELDSPYKVVNNIVYRLRRTLSVIGLDKLVIGKNGTFQINPNFNIHTDFDRFEDACIQLKTEENPDMRHSLYHSAVDIYKGQLLPRCEHELWLMQLSMYYQSLYLQITKGYVRLKMECKDYILAQKTAIDALRFDPKDSELNMYAILAMGFQGNLSMAQTYYTAAKPYLALEHAEVIKKYQQFRERKPQFFLSDAHRRRWTHWRERCWRLSDRNKAALFLLTAYESLWRRMVWKCGNDGFDFQSVRLGGIEPELYSVYQAAKAIAVGCCNITLADLVSPELVTDEAFHLITGALLMAKYGDVVLNLEKGADIT